MEVVRPGSEHGVYAPVRVDPRGITGPTKRQAASDDWRRTSRGFYVPSHVEATPAQRAFEAGTIVSKHAAVTGWAALAWLGGWWFSGLEPDAETPLPVPIAASRHRMRQQPGLHICEERFDPRDVIVVDGIPITTAVRSVWFEMRYAGSLRAAAVVLDLAAFHDLVSVFEAWEFAHRHPSYTGIEQCRDAIWLADENSWSPAEPEMRMHWTEAGFPRPLTNRPVFDLNGKHLGTPDLIDPEMGVFGEYEGKVHFSGAQRFHDLKREEKFRAHGLEGVTMVAADRADPQPFRERLRGAYERAARLPRSNRQWTLELPHWWQPTFSVMQRRALTAEERQVWLRHRAA
jgi:hypothetical protein